MNRAMTKEDVVLLQLLSKELFKSEERVELDAVRLESLYKEAKAQTVIAMAFNSLPASAAEMDPEIYVKWQNTAFIVLKQTLNNNFANAKLTSLLEENGIEHCTIKGYSSSKYYPNPDIRQMGDIDFLVYEKDVKKSTDLLLENGFVLEGHDEGFHIAFKKEKIEYELHTNVSVVPKGKEHVLRMFDDTISKSFTVNTKCGIIRIPDTFHHGFSMLLHMQRHMVRVTGIGLRHLCDWAVFVNSFSNEEWCEIFEKKLKQAGFWTFAKVISKTAEKYLKLPPKEWFADADDDLAEALLNDIFDSGNFGRKNSMRSRQGVFVDRDLDGKNKISRVFAELNKLVYNWRPFFKKNKWLLPIGYLAYVANFFYKIIFKKKSFNLIKVYREGSKQQNTYSKLKFFKEEK